MVEWMVGARIRPDPGPGPEQAQLAARDAQLATLRTEHRRELRELHAAHEEQLRVAEAHGRHAR